MTVLNTNRTPIERVLGVDLVYYTHRYCSFVIVQYKMFRNENGKWTYRPDDQFEEELRRMRVLPAAEWDGSAASFRLSSDPRYLKLCWPQSDEPTATELVKGRYLPVEFWEGAEKGLFRGKRDGLVIHDESLDRSFTNSGFIDLVAAGWIGTRGAPTETIEEVILASLDANRSVMLAVHTPSGRAEDGEERSTSG
ncbi:MAG TPA: hypothetical protein VM784_15065 [Actinomycetota bacterium]|nr:hypothetical protein [Actinomycetota bacterium]